MGLGHMVAFERSLFVVLASMCAVGCGDAPDLGSDGRRHVVFRGPEIEARLEADPGARFTIDLREDVVYELDQSEQAIDLSAFDLQRPSATPPVDFLSWVDQSAPCDEGRDVLGEEHFVVSRGDLMLEPEGEVAFRAGPLACPGDDVCWWAPSSHECYFLCAK